MSFDGNTVKKQKYVDGPLSIINLTLNYILINALQLVEKANLGRSAAHGHVGVQCAARRSDTDK